MIQSSSCTTVCLLILLETIVLYISIYHLRKLISSGIAIHQHSENITCFTTNYEGPVELWVMNKSKSSVIQLTGRNINFKKNNHANSRKPWTSHRNETSLQVYGGYHAISHLSVWILPTPNTALSSLPVGSIMPVLTPQCSFLGGMVLGRHGGIIH